MAVILSKDPASTVKLLSTFGTATLLGKDGRGVQVPLAPLLGASSLVRSIVDSSQLHPGIYGPLMLSFDIAVDILAHVREILGTGESNIKSGNIENVIHVLSILEVGANLSKTRINIENNEQQIAVIKEDIKLEVVFESISDEDTDLCVSGDNEAKDDPYGQCCVNVEKSAVCPDPKYSTNSSASKDKQKSISNACEHSAKSAYDLNVLSKTGSNRGVIGNSNLNQTADKQYSCNICMKSFSQKSHLQTHSRFHTGEKPYTCKICNKSFADQSNLNKHRRIHTGERPFTCQICASTFAHQSALRQHRRVHTGEKPFECKVCDFATADRSVLKSHNMRHTGERPHKCKICAYSCRRNCDLKDHMIKHTGEKAFKCQICEFSAKTRYEIRKHKKVDHKL